MSISETHEYLTDECLKYEFDFWGIFKNSILTSRRLVQFQLDPDSQWCQYNPGVPSVESSGHLPSWQHQVSPPSSVYPRLQPRWESKLFASAGQPRTMNAKHKVSKRQL